MFLTNRLVSVAKVARNRRRRAYAPYTSKSALQQPSLRHTPGGYYGYGAALTNPVSTNEPITSSTSSPTLRPSDSSTRHPFSDSRARSKRA